MGECAQLVEHIEFPDDVPVNLVGQLFVGEGPIVFAVEKPLCISADQFASVADVIQPNLEGSAGIYAYSMTPVFYDNIRIDRSHAPIRHGRRQVQSALEVAL